MSAHLRHKLPWDLVVDFVTPYKDQGIRLPVGSCDKIHLINRKVELQVKNHQYIQEDDICKDSTCPRKSEEKTFYKSRKQLKPFARRPGGQVFDEEKEKKFKQFVSCFEKAILEFVQTELDTPAKDLEYEVDKSGFVSFCDRCNDFITLLEFGDKKKLFEYSDEEIAAVFRCQHGGQAVGRNLPFLMYHILPFYLAMNTILHADLKKKDWPRDMKPDSYFWNSLLRPCDGQTFLPQSRKYLSEAMIDFEKTKILNKNLFRFIYFYVLMKKKIDENYSFVEDFHVNSWFIRSIM